MAKKINKKLDEMSIFELHQMKDIVFDVADNYSRQLARYNSCDFNTYLENMNDYEKSILDKRLKCRKLYEYINSIIENKITEYYVEEN